MAIYVWGIFSDYLIPVTVFIFCYARILVVMRRQMRVMAAHSTEGTAHMNASQIQSKRVQWNITKTMLIVSLAFAVCWLPTTIYFIIVDNTKQTSDNLFVGYTGTVFLSILYICMNPFIYAVKHDGVKERLGHLIVCFKRFEHPVSVGNATTSNADGRTAATGTQQ